MEEGREEEERDWIRPTGLDDDRGETRDDFDFDAYLDDPTPGYRYAVNNHAEHEDQGDGFWCWRDLLRDRLSAQVGLLPVSDRQRMLAAFLIGNLDGAGYLRTGPLCHFFGPGLWAGRGGDRGRRTRGRFGHRCSGWTPRVWGPATSGNALLLQLDRKLEALNGRCSTPVVHSRWPTASWMSNSRPLPRSTTTSLVARLDAGDDDALRAGHGRNHPAQPQTRQLWGGQRPPHPGGGPRFPRVPSKGTSCGLQINGRNAPELQRALANTAT